MHIDPRSSVVCYGLAKMQMSAELADLRAGMEAEWAALKSEFAAALAELRAARAELENLKTLRAVDEATKSKLARRRTLTEAAAGDADTTLQ
jgi:hypothetical protein